VDLVVAIRNCERLQFHISTPLEHGLFVQGNSSEACRDDTPRGIGETAFELRQLLLAPPQQENPAPA